MPEYRIQIIDADGPTVGAIPGGLDFAGTGTTFTVLPGDPTFMTVDDTDSFLDGPFTETAPGIGTVVDDPTPGTGFSSGNGDGFVEGDTVKLQSRWEALDSSGNVIGEFYFLIISSGIGPITALTADFPIDEGATYEIGFRLTRDRVDYSDIRCFTAGSQIRSASGNIAVEDLRVGDMVETLDHGPQPILWIGSSHQTTVHLRQAPEHLPIRIAKGALGNGLPVRDLMVSPQHRMLVSHDVASTVFGSREVLVPAKFLTGLDGVSTTTIAEWPEGVTYYHMLFQAHEIVEAEGAWSESLHTGDQALKSLAEEARQEIIRLFPELDSLPDRNLARPALLRWQGEYMAVKLGGSRPAGARPGDLRRWEKLERMIS